MPCAEHTLLAQQAYFHPRGKLAMPNGFSVYYRGRHLKGMSQNRLLLTPEKSLTMKRHRSPPNNSNGIFSVSFPYRFRIVSVSFPYCFRIVSVSFPYRFRIVSVSFSYCSPIVLLLFSYCSPIVLLLGSGNNTETIRKRYGIERMRNGGTRVVNLTII